MQFSLEKIGRDGIAATDILLPAGWHAKLPFAEGIGKNLQNESSEGGRLTHWISLLLDYFDTKAPLVIADRERQAVISSALFLIAIALLLSLTSVLMYGTSLLYLVASLFGLSLGWSGLICGAISTLASLLFFFLRVQLRKPIFQMSLKDLGGNRVRTI